MSQDSAPRKLQPNDAESSEQVSNAPPIVVKKYANRRLYNTETSSYITLENLAGMVRAGRDFVVYDAKSGDDITRGVLTQIIVEEESKGSAMLPTAFLRQLIAFYGGNLQGVVPQYLEHAMSSFSRQQQRMREMVERTFSPFLPTGVEEMNRQNMALFERAFSMWNPFHVGGEAKPADEGEQAGSAVPEAHTVPAAQEAELSRLRSEVESLQRQLAAAHAAAVVAAHAQASSSAEATAPAAATVLPANVLSDPAPAPANAGPKPPRRARNSTAAQG